MVTLRVMGEPVPKSRPRFAKGRAYTPKRTKEYEEKIALDFIAAHEEKVSGEIELWLTFALQAPKNVPKAKRQEMLSGLARPSKRPDLDNLIKAVMDGLNGIAYDDDKQVVQITAQKIYADEPYTDILMVGGHEL